MGVFGGSMAFFPVISFVLLLLVGSVDSFGRCPGASSMPVTFDYSAVYRTEAECLQNSSSCPSSIYSDYYGAYLYGLSTNFCGYGSSNGYGYRRVCSYTQCSEESPDTTYHCQNSGGADIMTGGSPLRALIFKCFHASCVQTATLNGTCQDWGFCPDGVDDCDVKPDSTGHPPCNRSGAEFVASSSCYYQCADGNSLRCPPVSTQYVAGAMYAGQCPQTAPKSCYGKSSSSGGGNSSSSGGGSSSSSFDPNSSSGGGGNSSSSGGGGGGGDTDYMPILVAIHDTLHRANEQRDILQSWDYTFVPNVTNSLKNIEESDLSTQLNTSTIKNSLLTLQENGFTLPKAVRQDIDSQKVLLNEIKEFLKYDSLHVTSSHDTSYNPLLRDIQHAIETNTDSVSSAGSRRDSSVFVRDSAFAKWWSNYYSDSASSRGLVGQALNTIVQSMGDSAKQSLCSAFNSCLRTAPNPKQCLLMPESRSCMDGGSPFDTEINIVSKLLESVWDGFFGDDTAGVSESVLDTHYVPPAVADSAENGLLYFISSVFNPDSLNSALDSARSLADSARKNQKDSVSIQPDSLWLDSSDAVQYVESILLPSGTGTDCFVCHASLGTLGGLSRNELAIDIDFSNFGGFNFCEIVRAVIKIMTLVVCISLTLGSWAAAFGYNPKNDS